MKAGPVFAHSGIFIAFLDRPDQYHQGCPRVRRPQPRRARAWALMRVRSDNGDQKRRSTGFTMSDETRVVHRDPDILGGTPVFVGRDG